jgi:hypothetical protein
MPRGAAAGLKARSTPTSLVRAALLVEEGDQRLADAEFGDRRLDGVEGRVGAHGVGGARLHRLLVARREGAQRVLHAVAELAEHRVGHVERVLGDEIHADALGADQAHHLLDLLQQRRRRIVEQQVGLVEEEGQLGLVGSPASGSCSNSSASSQSRKVE